MKVIFLDIDGVLNTKETYDNIYRTHGFLSTMEVPIDKFRLEYLKTIIDETDAKIVLSSSFRHFFIKQEDKLVPASIKGKKLYDCFLKYGMDIYDVTPINGYTREEEIKEWLINNEEVEDFIIIDDDPLQFDEYQDRLIQTSEKRQNYLLSFMKFSTGLCEEHIDQAEEMLNSKMKPLKR